MQGIANIREVEDSFIGGVIKDPESIDDLALIVREPYYFESVQDRTIWRGILGLYSENKTPELQILIDYLLKRGKLEEAGGRTHLVECVENAGIRLDEYAAIIKNNYQVNKIHDSFSEIATEASEEGADARELVNRAEGTLLSLEDPVDLSPIPLGGFIEGFVNDVCTAEKKDKYYVDTRIADLNAEITGFFRGDVIIVAAPPSMGKTSFALDTCMFNMNRGRTSLFISLDQSKASICQRQLTALTGITKAEMFSGHLSERQKDHLCQKAAELATADKLLITDNPMLTALDIRSMSRKIKRQRGLDILVIDYIQQIKPHKRFESRNLELTEISGILKSIAKELDVAVLALSQLNREYANVPINPEKNQWGFPSVTMLRESGALEQDANMVVFPHVPFEVMKKKYGTQSDTFQNWIRQNPDLESLAYIVVGKNKDGWTGTVECKRDLIKMRFYSETNRAEI